ncbi:MAG TPA: hypothetical protein VMS76_13675 [Planctomycetota bacterium]|nr:hypothetical protein [Planctomycetota bacterium]
MITTLLALSALAPLPSTSTLDGNAELVMLVTPTRFAAVNPTASSQLLIFREIVGGARASVLVPPGGDVDYAFASGTLHGLSLEVVSSVNGALSTTGALSLEELATAEFEDVWVFSYLDHSHAWGESLAQFWLVPPIDSAFDDSLHTGCAEPDSSTLPLFHIPVITSSDIPPGDLPPRIEEEPLPAV